MTNETDKPENDSRNKLIIIPTHEELKQKVEKLRAEVAMLVLERDHLRLQECRFLETAYMLAVGGLEYKAFELQCAVQRLKRKLEMIQAKRNREEEVSITQINKDLDIEFAEYQQRINEKIDRMNQALEHSGVQLLTAEETKEIKKKYCSIVKAMHPDLHPNLSEEEHQLFVNAIKAYKNGDIDTIRIIYTMRGEALLKADEDPAAELAKEKTRLEKVLASLQESIKKIKNEFPYTMKGFLEDKEQIEAKKRELQNLIAQYKETVKQYQERIDAILR